MTKEEFLKTAEEYEQQTGYMSFQHMMRFTPAYKKLIEAGKPILPWIIEGFENHLKKSIFGLERNDLWGMEWVLILIDLTGETPIQPKPIKGTVFAAWSVNDTCKAWIDWFRKN